MGRYRVRLFSIECGTDFWYSAEAADSLEALSFARTEHLAAQRPRNPSRSSRARQCGWSR
jgi:hypothetical protein